MAGALLLFRQVWLQGCRPVNGEEHRQHIAGSVAGAFVVEAVGGGQAGPLGVAAATHQGGHAVPVQRPRLAEVHKVQHNLLTCETQAEQPVMWHQQVCGMHRIGHHPVICKQQAEEQPSQA